MLFAHGPLSVLANEYIQKKQLKKIDHRFIPLILTIALVAGILPDFDFFILAAQSKPAFLHHHLITHTPIFWIAVSLLLRQGLFIIKRYLPKFRKQILTTELINILTLTFLIGTLSHIISDLVLGDIMLLYPFTHHAFTIFGDIFRLNPGISYMSHPFAVVEVFMVLLFVYYILNTYFEIGKKKLLLFLIASSLVLFSFFIYTSYLYGNTYIPTVQNDEYNRPNFDSDNDWQIDTHDTDINNNGKDNIEDVQRSQIAKIAEKVGASYKFADINSDNALQRFGVLTPYSMISTVYSESKKNLEPVIKQHLINQKENIEYSLDSYLKVLKNRNKVETYNPNRENSRKNFPGYTLFILDNKNRTVNAGIFISNRMVVIISPFDKRMRIHTLTEITDVYHPADFKYLIEKQDKELFRL